MMKTKEIINGSLYVNEKTNQIERVRSKANSQSVFTTVHNENLKIVKSKDLSIASTFQVCPLCLPLALVNLFKVVGMLYLSALPPFFKKSLDFFKFMGYIVV
jgi:hypothetical protein